VETKLQGGSGNLAGPFKILLFLLVDAAFCRSFLFYTGQALTLPVVVIWTYFDVVILVSQIRFSAKPVSRCHVIIQINQAL
ncbi:MAG TPA: hypothetical protein VGE06_06000, partial [Flavisolibacter sp.]